MKISSSLSQLISTNVIEIQDHFRVKFGIVGPLGIIGDDSADFFVHFDNELRTCYLTESLNQDLDIQTNRLTDFLIDLHEEIRKGQFIVKELRRFKNYQFIMAPDGIYDVAIKTTRGFSFFSATFDQLPNDLKKFIKETE